MRNKRVLFALVVATLVVLAGCTGGGPPRIGTESPTTSLNTTTGTLSVSSTETPTTTASTGSLEVHFINVGQSASILVVSPDGETMLIDSGDWRNDGKYVLQYLRQQNITRIDHLVTSHADATTHLAFKSRITLRREELFEFAHEAHWW